MFWSMGRFMAVPFAAFGDASRRAVAGEDVGATESVLLQAVINTAATVRTLRRIMERTEFLFVVWE